MIVRIMSSGRSFKGLAQYLCHDVQANTHERVAWTQSLNCAHDDELSVVHEMYTTMLDADLLKEEAGSRAGYGLLKKPVKHVSLSWHESDEPTPEHMRETTEAFLKHMGWDEQQAFIVAHSDKDYQHLHVMLNAVHPETGLKLDDRFEKRRAQDWALDYERSQERIHCEQRLRPADEREPEMSRDAWQAMKDAEAHEAGRRRYDASYMAKEDRREILTGEEWKLLKDGQRQEREAFMAENSLLYRDLRKETYREVKAKFREDWAEYYAAKRAGEDATDLAAQRQGILDRQKDALSERLTVAFAELREGRDALYDELKATQRAERAELHERQARGLSSPHLLDTPNVLAPASHTPEQMAEPTPHTAWNEARREMTSRREQPAQRRDEEHVTDPAHLGPGLRDPVAGIAGIGLGGLGGLAAIGERFFDGFLGGGEMRSPPPRAPVPEAEFKPRNPFAEAASVARQQIDEQEQKRSRDFWDDRERQRD